MSRKNDLFIFFNNNKKKEDGAQETANTATREESEDRALLINFDAISSASASSSAVVSTPTVATTYKQNFSDESKSSLNQSGETAQNKQTSYPYIQNNLTATAVNATTNDKQRPHYQSLNFNNNNSNPSAESNKGILASSANRNNSGLLVDIGLFSDLEAKTLSQSQISPAYAQHHHLIDKNTNKILNQLAASNSASATANSQNAVSTEPGDTFKLRSKFTNSRLLINFGEEADSQMINQNYAPNENNNLNYSINSYDSISATPGQIMEANDHTQRSNQYTTALDENFDVNILNSTSSSVSDHCHVLKNNSLLDKKRNANVWRKLITVLIMCVLFMIGEIVGGIIAHSISIQTDAAHMAADIAGFFLSIVAIYMSGKGI
jgi:hypothetical protein